jgi:hypothetical protein
MKSTEPTSTSSQTQLVKIALASVGYHQTVQAHANGALSQVWMDSTLKKSSLEMSKKKLLVYYTLLQQNERKTRDAMAAYVEAAAKYMMIPVDTPLATFMSIAKSMKDRENSLPIGDAFERDYHGMELLCDSIPKTEPLAMNDAVYVCNLDAI